MQQTDVRIVGEHFICCIKFYKCIKFIIIISLDWKIMLFQK